MRPTTLAAVARLPAMTVNQLREEYRRAFGEVTASRHKTWLIRRVAWQLQANDEGGLSERALARAAELARDADLRLTAPRRIAADEIAAAANGPRTKTVPLPQIRDAGLAPGTQLRREWKGALLVVTVLHEGFEYDGQVFRSLSGVAKAITGTKWNGHAFFGLKHGTDAA